MRAEYRKFVRAASDETDNDDLDGKDVDFELLLKEYEEAQVKLEELSSKNFNKWSIPDSHIEKLWKKIRSRIDKECGVHQALSVLPLILELLPPDYCQPQNLESGVEAGYCERRKEIYTTQEVFLDDRTICEQFLKYGFSTDVRLLHHEFIHYLQNKNFSQYLPPPSLSTSFTEDLIDLLLSFKFFRHKPKIQKINKTILEESHAYNAANRQGRSFYSLHHLYDKFLRHYEFDESDEKGSEIESKKLEKIIISYWQIRQLYALGLGDEEIALLVSTDVWDEKKKHYKNLSAAVSRLQAEKGLDDQDVDNIILANDIRSQIYIIKARSITIEESLREAQECKNNTLVKKGGRDE